MSLMFGMFLGFVAGVFLTQTWRDYIKELFRLLFEKLKAKLR